MPRVLDIIDYVEGLAGHSLNRDEGVFVGSPLTEVSTAVVTWMATRDALEFAGREGAELVVCHESLYHPYGAELKSDNPPGWRNWQVNRQRRELFKKYDLTVLRIHGTLDQICIFDHFASLLGLGEPVEAEGLVKVYEIEPVKFGDLVRRVKERVGMKAVRVSAPNRLERVVRRVGLPWGGLGLFVNVGYQQSLLNKGCDVFIAGESDNVGFRFSAECGIPVIETGHEISENPGLEHFSKMLEERFPGLIVKFHRLDSIWQML